MGTPVVIADEITAAGYRLAGARTIVPDDPRSVVRDFDGALDSCELLLITAELARHVPADRLAEALLVARPLLVVVPDAGGRVEPPSLEHELRSALGVES
jgi:vacuolar-type H+-ATPase subunit F/Vma7